MGKIVAGLFISLDGVVEAPETWHFPYVNDEMLDVVSQMHAAADTLLLGRHTYEIFAGAWPNREGVLADQINNIKKLVVSTSLDKADWSNSTVLRENAIEELTMLKQQVGKNILISGSVTLTRSLLRVGLIDELRLLVHPIVLGSGQRLFDSALDELSLALADSTTFSTGVVDLQYRPVA